MQHEHHLPDFALSRRRPGRLLLRRSLLSVEVQRFPQCEVHGQLLRYETCQLSFVFDVIEILGGCNAVWTVGDKVVNCDPCVGLSCNSCAASGTTILRSPIRRQLVSSIWFSGVLVLQQIVQDCWLADD